MTGKHRAKKKGKPAPADPPTERLPALADALRVGETPVKPYPYPNPK
jgi:hypothetical protein